MTSAVRQSPADVAPGGTEPAAKDIIMLFHRYLKSFYLRYAPLYLLGIAALIAVNYAQLYIPEYLGRLVDLCTAAAQGGTRLTVADIGDLLLGVLLVAVILFVGRSIWRLSIFNASGRTEAGLRRLMFEKSERLSPRYYHENKVGGVMAWFTSDLSTVEEYLGWGTVMSVDAVFLSILTVWRMIRLDWVMTLFLLLPLLLIVLWGALVEKYMALKWDARQQAFDRLYDFSQESFTGLAVIKAFVKETQELHAFAKVARRNRDENISFVRVSVLFDVIISVIIGVCMAALLALGGYFVWRLTGGTPAVIFGHTMDLTAGGVVTFIGYFDTLIWPMMAMGQIVSMRSRFRASMRRITRFLDEEEELRDAPGAAPLTDVQGGIAVRHLTFAYPSTGNDALSDVSFTVAPGETVGIVGRVGCGKTTLVSLLLRLWNVPEGTVLFDGQDIMHATAASVREAVAYVPQDQFLFSDTIRGNIALAKPGASDEEIRAAARFADVDDNITAFRDGYDTVLGERGVTLSGGQKQRVAMARAALKNAPIMIFDDSVSAVDMATEERILSHIREERRGKTTLIVASRVSTVAGADRILVLRDGRVEAFDTPARLSETSETYRTMVRLQALEREAGGGETA